MKIQKRSAQRFDFVLQLALVIVAAFTLTGCAPAAPEPYDIAWGACIDTYDETPVVNQNGDAIKVLSPEESCTSYVETVGRSDFIDTWTDEAWVTKHRDQLRLIAELREGL